MRQRTAAARGERRRAGTLPARRRFTVDEYHRMGEAGILYEDDRVELINGEIIEMPPIGSLHMGTVVRVSKWLERTIGDRVLVSVQNPIRLSTGSELQPDIALLRPRGDFYTTAIPVPEDVLLVIEVVDTSLRHDRDVKVPLYGRAGALDVWLLDVRRRRVTVFREPAPNGYQQVIRHTRPATLTPLSFPGLELRWEDLFG